MHKTPQVRFEFHISRLARDRYQFDQSLFSLSGNVLFANFFAARQFAQRMNARRNLIQFPEQAVRSGQINAMGMIDEILHHVASQYRQLLNPSVMEQALAWLYDHEGEEQVDRAIYRFASEFPPLVVYQREVSLDEYLAGESLDENGQPVSNRLIALEEMLMLWLENANPAFAPFHELFDDSDLATTTVYPQIMVSLHQFFDTQPVFGPENQNLIDMLRSPAIHVPYSLEGQLEFIRTRWGMLLGRYLYRLLSSLDLIKEESKAVFGGPGPARVIEFAGLEAEPENFSPDKDWMPNLVLMAKNSYVWLDQLSKKYKRLISHLDQIPDEELDMLARWGFTGLWLIGLWERSAASKRIKQLRGNPEAVASAYSLFSYEIAGDLGGEEAYRNLRDRAWKRGIRLSSDMVPNHMGIDSRWLVEHPDWFVSLDYSPFPAYSFNGPNLSWDERVGIYLEDHYFDNSDAAVVFKRVDFWSGDTRYVYHGNDGTSMPWNDTAQLNYLMADVREAVIQTILHVARKFPVIRFDAAMTLAKRHYQRLWFPEPGTGGDIPSRAEHGLTKSQFDALMPVEFWREVVDRVAEEVPDTLLLAEAFWLMEGYFVRTLGMHRVYNSAFMNMLRDEKNQEYRLVIKNTIEFDPEILKRYVNFMNNPDERTAVDQFGKGDKYIGIATLLATLPGLPMFGHGQVEGFTEKYGMEYRKAYWDEQPDGDLVRRHEQEVFPLMRRRYLFAGVENFLLYDFYTPDGYVSEDVFAYSNRVGDERSLVLYHNKWADIRGTIHGSAAYSVKTDSGDRRSLVQKSLGDGLSIPNDDGSYLIFRDPNRGLEFIRNCQQIHTQGLYIELGAYQRYVFLDFRIVQDNEWRHYAQLVDFLGGRGVPSIDEALKEIFLQPIHQAYQQLINPGSLRWLADHHFGAPKKFTATRDASLEEAWDKLVQLLQQVALFTGSALDTSHLAQELLDDLIAVLDLEGTEVNIPYPRSRKYKAALGYLEKGTDKLPPLFDYDLEQWGTLLSLIFTRKIGKAVVEDAQDYSELSRAWIDEWLLGKFISRSLVEMGISDARAQRSAGIVRLLTGQQEWCRQCLLPDASLYPLVEALFRDSEVQRFIGVNRYQDILWFNKEEFDELIWWLYLSAVVDIIAPLTPTQEEIPSPAALLLVNLHSIILKLQKAEAACGFQVDRFLAEVKAMD